jgi:hypothetical protein
MLVTSARDGGMSKEHTLLRVAVTVILAGSSLRGENREIPVAFPTPAAFDLIGWQLQRTQKHSQHTGLAHVRVPPGYQDQTRHQPAQRRLSLPGRIVRRSTTLAPTGLFAGAGKRTSPMVSACPAVHQAPGVVRSRANSTIGRVDAGVVTAQGFSPPQATGFESVW